MPKVSIILTSYNHAPFIGTTIESVLEQTFSDFEVLIWDDASTDDSVGIIEGFKDPRITLFQSEKPQQVITGINRLITEVACGEYIAMQHSDDVWAPEKLKKQVAYLDGHPDVGAVFTQAQVIDRTGALVNDESNVLNRMFDAKNRTRHEWLRHFFCVGNALCHPSALVRRQCYETCGAYRHSAVGLGDFEMWVRLCIRYEIHILEEKLTLFRYCADASNMSGDNPSFHACSAFTYFNILKRYKSIASFEELCAIFPEARQFDRGADTNVPFALAMTALEVSPHPFAKIFALGALYDLLDDDRTRQPLLDAYAFDRNTYAALVRQNDPLKGGALATLGSSYEACRRENEILQQQIQKLQSKPRFWGFGK